MKNAFAIAALAAVISTGTLGAASAMPAHTPKAESAVQLAGHRDRDFRHDKHRILPRKVIMGSLYRQGYRDIRNVNLVRGDYIVIARGYRGPVRLVVDGRTGHVISRDLLRRNWNHPGFRMQGGNGSFSYSFGIR